MWQCSLNLNFPLVASNFSRLVERNQSSHFLWSVGSRTVRNTHVQVTTLDAVEMPASVLCHSTQLKTQTSHPIMIKHITV